MHAWVQLDALDSVVLHYRVGWPLSAIITQDTLQVGRWALRLPWREVQRLGAR